MHEKTHFLSNLLVFCYSQLLVQKGEMHTGMENYTGISSPCLYVLPIYSKQKGFYGTKVLATFTFVSVLEDQLLSPVRFFPLGFYPQRIRYKHR